MQRTTVDALPTDVFQHVLSYLPHKDVCNASTVSKKWKAVARDVPLEGTGTTLGQLNQVMSDFEFTGYHANRLQNGPRLYRAPTSETPSNSQSGLRLGPGFYFYPVGEYDLFGKCKRGSVPQSAASWAVGGGRGLFPVFTRGLKHQYNLETEGGNRWPYPGERYLHPPFDAVTGQTETLNTETKLNPHFYDPKWREHELKLLEGDRSEEAEEKRQYLLALGQCPVGLQIATRRDEQGALGRAFLEAIGERYQREYGVGVTPMETT